MKKTYKMVLAFPRIFDLPEELHGKSADLDRGDAKSKAAWKRNLAKNPQATVDAYFTSEEDMQDLLDCSEFSNEILNPQTGEKKPAIKDAKPDFEDFGIGKYIQLKRKFNNIIEFIDKKGEPQEIDKGGAPSVKIFSPEENAFVEYDYMELGAPANGTVSKVRFEVYNGTTRLEAFGITELVEWVENENPEEEF